MSQFSCSPARVIIFPVQIRHGGAETFFGKSKASTMDKKLSKLTTIVAIVFVVLVLVAYLTQGVGKKTTLNTSGIACQHRNYG